MAGSQARNPGKETVSKTRAYHMRRIQSDKSPRSNGLMSAPINIGGYGAAGYEAGLPGGISSRVTGRPGNTGRFAARTPRTATGTVAPPMKFNVTTLIYRWLEQKRAFFAAFLTLNHFDFSVLTKKPAKNFSPADGSGLPSGAMMTNYLMPVFLFTASSCRRKRAAWLVLPRRV
jgi:hypothetical protein